MTKLKKIDYFVISLFTIIEIALYLSFLFIDKNIIKSDLDSSILKYLGIICALLFSFYSLFKKKKAINLFIPLALIFTLISDYFLLFNKETSLYVYGLITFIITQVIYFCFIYAIRKRRSEFFINLIIRIVLSLFALLLAYYLNYFDTLTVLALLYFVELVSNFIYSIALIKEDKKYFLFSLGLLLFIACDINVGLNNVHLIEGIDYTLVNFLMRVFYLPSQVLLSLTSIIVDKKDIRFI